MAISHVCQGCGVDLARVRAALDSDYGLPVVVCPRCERAAVRRRTEFSCFAKQFHRLDSAVLILGVQIVCCIGLGFACLFTPYAVVTKVGLSAWPSLPEEQLLIIFAGLLALGTGFYLRVGFARFTPWKIWFAWCGWVFCLAIIAAIVQVANANVDVSFQSIITELVPIEALQYGFFFLFVPLVFLGMPLGSLALAGHRRAKRGRWSWRRKRRRAMLQR